MRYLDFLRNCFTSVAFLVSFYGTAQYLVLPSDNELNRPLGNTDGKNFQSPSKVYYLETYHWRKRFKKKGLPKI